jgi:hypothetical protein
MGNTSISAAHRPQIPWETEAPVEVESVEAGEPFPEFRPPFVGMGVAHHAQKEITSGPSVGMSG